MYSATVLKEILGRSTGTIIPVELLPTDRILQRWDVSISSGIARDSERVHSKPPPLDEDTAYIVDRLILKAKPKVYVMINTWYRTPATTAKIARRLRIRRDDVEGELILSLCDIRVQFVETRNTTLAQLLRISL